MLKDANPEKVYVGTNIGESLAILSYRMKLTAGDIIELTDGTKAVVSDNHIDKLTVSCIVPIVGHKYEYRYSVMTVSYSVIKAPVRGKYVSLDTIVKVEGHRMARKLVEAEKGQAAYEEVSQLKEEGGDVSELAEILKGKNS